MRRFFTLAWAPIAVAACADHPVNHIASPVAVNNFQIPADGDPTYYSSQVNTTYYGGYAGYDNPNAARTTVYTQEYVWSSSSSFWDVRESFSPSYGPFGAEASTEPGVSQSVRTRSDLVAYDRAGQPISQPDTTKSLSSAPADAPATIMVQPMMTGFAGTTASKAVNPPGTLTNPPGRNALDAKLVTPAAAARVLAQLRKSATELPRSDEATDFEIRRAKGRSVLTYSHRYGAVTHTRAEGADGTVADTDYEYSAVPGGFILTEERTTVRLPNATQPLSIVRKYTEPSVR
jgi:hypothetical protein